MTAFLYSSSTGYVSFTIILNLELDKLFPLPTEAILQSREISLHYFFSVCLCSICFFFSACSFYMCDYGMSTAFSWEDLPFR